MDIIPGWVFFALLGTAIFGSFLMDSVLSRKRLRRFFDRGCLGREWRKCFPEAKKEEIREFLDVFVRAFGFSQKQRLNFSPADKVMEIYQARHPRWWPLDEMECESLALACEQRYKIDLCKAWRSSLTLGEIFEATRKGSMNP